MNDKNFEKMNIKIVLSIYLCTPVRNFSQLAELHNLGPNLPPKNINEKNFVKRNTKIVIST